MVNTPTLHQGSLSAKTRSLSRAEREDAAKHSGKMVIYSEREAIECKMASERAVLRAAPPGYELSSLNGLNIGAGGRRVSEYLTPIDLRREHKNAKQQLGSFLSPMMPLPFREETIDYIVSLHSLEHVPNPVEVVNHWLNIIKPGGGIGLILPDWRYCWDARKDAAIWGHKWNSEPSVVRGMHERHWSGKCELERLDSYDFKFSFDVILRKHGTFVAFQAEQFVPKESGRVLNANGRFPSDGYLAKGENSDEV